MHIADGILSAPILGGGVVLAVAGVAIGLRKTDYSQIPRVAVLSAVFFVASLIHIPIGPGQVHLLLNGLMGIILGWRAFPALLSALLFQAILFGYGGITAIGVNTVNMALPAVFCYYLYGPLLRRLNSRFFLLAAGFAAGGSAVILSGVMVAASLYFSNRQFIGVIEAILLAHLPVVLIEGVVTGSVVLYLKKTAPECFRA